MCPLSVRSTVLLSLVDPTSSWILRLLLTWVPRFGSHYHFGILSHLGEEMTSVRSFSRVCECAVLASWSSLRKWMWESSSHVGFR